MQNTSDVRGVSGIYCVASLLQTGNGRSTKVMALSPRFALGQCERDERVGGRVVRRHRLPGLELLLNLERELLAKFHATKTKTKKDP